MRGNEECIFVSSDCRARLVEEPINVQCACRPDSTSRFERIVINATGNLKSIVQARLFPTYSDLGKAGSDPIQPQACLIVLPLGKTGGNIGLPSHTGRSARRNCRRGDVCRCFVQPVAGVHTLLAVARTAGARRRHPGCILVSLGPLRRLGMASLGLLASSLGLAPLGLVPSLLPPLAPLLVGAVGLPLPLVLITRSVRRRRPQRRRPCIAACRPRFSRRR